MHQFKVGYKGIAGFFKVLLLPLMPAVPVACILWGLLSGYFHYADPGVKAVFEIVLALQLVVAAGSIMARMNQWLIISNDDILQRTTLPFHRIIWWCPWNQIESVRVWSDKEPSDPQAVIKRIVLRRPFNTPNYTQYNLTLGRNITEIRQVMDTISAKIPDKVMWEEQ